MIEKIAKCWWLFCAAGIGAGLLNPHVGLLCLFSVPLILIDLVYLALGKKQEPPLSAASGEGIKTIAQIQYGIAVLLHVVAGAVHVWIALYGSLYGKLEMTVISSPQLEVMMPQLLRMSITAFVLGTALALKRIYDVYLKKDGFAGEETRGEGEKRPC